ncbi:PspC domain-containing protein [Flavobacteriaceae bacterium Ap0902]|nr:PspC domain-containing protein [Flavobacteriaceae bacterium Ap0902]
MDKTHNISLGGFAFNIEDTAYKRLNRYLKEISVSIGNIAGADEIMTDVEFRMAELLRAKMMAREVVNEADVDYLIEVMGEPKDFYTEGFAEEEADFEKKTKSAYASTGKNKKLFRDPDDKMIGGVCAGLGHYVGMDATWVRILTVVALFIDPIFFSMGSMIFVGYLVLWLVVPLARTTSDKLQMRGEPVNVDTIRDFFGKSPENLKTKFNDVGDDARRVVSTSGSVLGDILRMIFKIIGIFILIILLIIALALVVSFVVAILGAGTALFGVGIASFSLNEYLPYLFENPWERAVLYVTLFLILVIPAIALILLVLRIISKRYSVPKFVGFGLPFLWLAGVFGLAILTGLTFQNFRNTAYDIKTVNIPTNASTIIMQRDYGDGEFDSEDLLGINPGYLTVPNTDDMTVRKSKTGFNYLELKYIAKGRTIEAAKEAVKPIKFNYSVEDSLVRLGQYTYIKEGEKWRNQKVEPILYLTDSTQVIFRNFGYGTADINGNKDWFDADTEKIYILDGDTFKCVSCVEDIDVEIDTDIESVGDNHDNQRESVDIKANKDSIQIKIK